MNCMEFRRAVGADPNHTSPEISAHRASCPACEQYAKEMQRLNGLIRRALEVPVRDRKAVRTVWSKRVYAMAASLLLTIGLGSALWLLTYPQDSLASEVAAHIVHEADSMVANENRIAPDKLAEVLQAKGMHLKQPMNDISYLQSCEFRNGVIPHLVVQTERGAVTVLLLPDEKVEKMRRFKERDYHGILVPMEHGSMAVLAYDPSLVDAVADKVKAAIAWNW